MMPLRFAGTPYICLGRMENTSHGEMNLPRVMKFIASAVV